MGIRRGFFKKGQYNITYSDMRGVDFSSNGSRNRFAYAENMYKDYDSLGEPIIESIPGFRKIASTGARINGIFSHKSDTGEDFIIIHAGTILYRFALSECTSVPELVQIGTARNEKSHAFTSSGILFILDGESMHAISPSGEHCTVGDDEAYCGYVPTTYLAGEAYEQANLLTRKAKEIYYLADVSSLAFGSEGIRYRITDEENRECAVVGAEESAVGELYIPSRIFIGSTPYTVREISSLAFENNTGITGIYIAEGIRKIGNLCFRGCSALTTAILPDSLTVIGNAAFDTCTSLARLHFGRALERLGNAVISFCSSLSSITYSGTAEEFAMIENTDVLGSTEIVYDSPYDAITVKIPIMSPAESVISVTIDDKEHDFEALEDSGRVTGVKLYFASRVAMLGKKVTVLVKLSESKDVYGSEATFVSSVLKDGDKAMNAISHCTAAETFDGRIFLTGNPSYPNACFFSGRGTDAINNPLYFGELNYFCDGVAEHRTVALLASEDSLAVMKEGDDGGGSVYYHTPDSTGIDIIPRIYPVSYIHGGIRALGAAISFFDDPVFICEQGLCALGKRAVNLSRTVEVRSHNVNAKLLGEELSRAQLVIWCGYLAVAIDGRIYLADSRASFTHSTGNSEYEWFYLCDIGTYSGDERVYRYSSLRLDGYVTKEEQCDERVEGLVFSQASQYGTVYFTVEDSMKVVVYPTEEYRGGSFSPACCVFALGKRLFFGTESGDVCVFNNDMRGVAPPSLTEDESFNAEDYKKRFGRQIHPMYYNFTNHAPRYAIQTISDNGGFAYLRKDSIKRSLTLKCKGFTSAKVICEVGTDRAGYSELTSFPSGPLYFSDLDFSCGSLSTDEVFSVSVAEREKDWCEKQIAIYSDEYSSPLGIYSISYSFTIRGHLGRNTR